MWNNPHMLVLDEPTNYLDRESLGALASGINEFGGAVVMISHNSGDRGGAKKPRWRLIGWGLRGWLSAVVVVLVVMHAGEGEKACLCYNN